MKATTQGTAEAQGALWGARPSDWTEQESRSVALFRAAIERLAIGEGTRVLDIGCGSGLFPALAAASGASVAGIDAAEPLLAVARERVPSGDFRVGDLQWLPFEDGTFDVVTAFNSIQYAIDATAAAAEAKRVTSAGGSVFVVVWGREEATDAVAILRALRPLLPPAPAGAPGPFALSYVGALEGVLAGAGLSVRDEGYLTAVWEYEDDRALLRANLAAGPCILAAKTAGEEAVRKALLEAMRPFRTSSGGYRLETEWRYAHATA